MPKKSKSKKSSYHFGVACVICGQRLFSFHVHDYKTCGCLERTMVDGGKEYLRFGWTTAPPRKIRFTERLDGKYPELEKVKDRWPY